MSKHNFNSVQQQAISDALDVAKQYAQDRLEPSMSIPPLITPAQREAIVLLNAAANQANATGVYDNTEGIGSSLLGAESNKPPRT